MAGPTRRLVGVFPMTVLLRAFEPDDTEQVVALWREAGLLRPWNDPHADITRKLAVQPELFRVAVDDGGVVGSVMAGSTRGTGMSSLTL